MRNLREPWPPSTYPLISSPGFGYIVDQRQVNPISFPDPLAAYQLHNRKRSLNQIKFFLITCAKDVVTSHPPTQKLVSVPKSTWWRVAGIFDNLTQIKFFLVKLCVICVKDVVTSHPPTEKLVSVPKSTWCYVAYNSISLKQCVGKDV